MRSIVLLILAASILRAADAQVTPSASPATPKEITAPAGDLVTLTAPAAATWLLGTESKIGFWPDGATCRVSCPPGRHVVIAITPTAVLRWVICDGGPQPMPPGPNPNPPQPVDALAKKLSDAFAADAGDAKQKREDVLQLATLYSLAIKCCGDSTLTTPRKLLAKVKEAGDSEELLGKRLELTRKAFSAEFGAMFLGSMPPTKENVEKALDTLFVDANRKAAADLFKRAEVILETLGK